MKYIIKIYWILFFFSGCVYASSPLDLWRVYELAQTHYEDFDIAKYNLDIQYQQNRQVKSSLFPKINFGSNINQTDTNNHNGLDANTTNRSSFINISQPVFNRVNSLNNKKTQHTTRLVDLDYKKSIQNFTYDIVNAYFQVLDTQVNITQQKNYLDFLERNKIEIYEKYQARQVTKIDKLELESNYQSAKLEAKRLKNILYNDKRILAGYIGLDNTAYRIKHPDYKKLMQLTINDNWNYWSKLAQGNNYDLKIGQTTILSKKADVKIAAAGHLPSVNFNLRYSDTNNTSDNRFSTLRNNETVYGLQLSIPIFQGQLVDAQISQAQDQQEKSQLTLEKTRKNLTQKLRTTYENTLFFKQRVSTLQQLSRANNAKLDAIKRSFAVGQRTNLDVLLAAQTGQESERDTKQAMHQYLLNYLQLQVISGVLSEESVRQINEGLFVTQESSTQP